MNCIENFVGLNYGCGVNKIAKVLNIDSEEATKIYNNYNNVLYKGITEYKEKVISVAKKDKEVHLGLGCYIKCDNIDNDERTIFNSTIQFWSILTMLTINKLHQLIDLNNYQNDIKVINTIYDSIYIVVKKDSKIIKWLNDNIITLITQDYVENQKVHNEGSGEIGYNWYDLKGINNNASIEEIEDVISKLEK